MGPAKRMCPTRLPWLEDKTMSVGASWENTPSIQTGAINIQPAKPAKRGRAGRKDAKDGATRGGEGQSNMEYRTEATAKKPKIAIMKRNCGGTQ